MSFGCKFQLNNGAINGDDKVIFLEFIDAGFEMFHKAPVKIARILFNGEPAFIYSNCPAFPKEKGKLISGQQLTEDSIIGYFTAKGEDIPYAKPYAIIRLEELETE